MDDIPGIMMSDLLWFNMVPKVLPNVSFVDSHTEGDCGYDLIMKSSLKVENDAVCSNHPPSRPRQFLLVHYLSSLSKSFRAYWIFWLS